MLMLQLIGELEKSRGVVRRQDFLERGSRQYIANRGALLAGFVGVESGWRTWITQKFNELVASSRSRLGIDRQSSKDRKEKLPLRLTISVIMLAPPSQ
jgi:hypothetical protein